MHMRRQVPSRSFLSRDCGAVLAVLVTFLLAIFASAADPDNAKAQPAVPSAGPLVVPFVECKPEQLAALTLAAPCTPRTASWSALSTIYTGASLDEPAWSLRGVFSTRPGRINAGTSLLFLTGFGPPAATPLTELSMLLACQQRDCWVLLNTNELRPFPEFFLTPGFIRDRRGIFVGEPEYEAFWQVLVQAHYTSAKAFATSARRDVTYAHLFREPERYRGQVVHLSGRLVRLQRWTAPDEARAAGVANLYEAWIMTDAYGENPACFVFTDLPDGLKLDNERKYNEPVGIDGYFYKRYRYKAGDSRKPNEYRDAPLLIGHTLAGRFGVRGDNVESEIWGQNLIWVFLSVVGGTVVGVLGLTLWFRYHDRRVRHRLRASQNTEFVPPFEEAMETEPRP